MKQNIVNHYQINKLLVFGAALICYALIYRIFVDLEAHRLQGHWIKVATAKKVAQTSINQASALVNINHNNQNTTIPKQITAQNQE